MTNEEIQRAMEFIIQQQAKYDARLEKDGSRLSGEEDKIPIGSDASESQRAEFKLATA